MDVTGHDSDLALARCNDSGAVGPDHSRVRTFTLECRHDSNHVESRNALRDANNQRQTGGGRLQNRVCGKRGGHVDHTRVGAGLGHGFGDRVKDGYVQNAGTAFSRRHACDHLRAVFDRLLGMKLTGLAGEALTDNPGVFINENTHEFLRSMTNE